MTRRGSSRTTMRAWGIDAYDESIRLMEFPVPEPGPHDVLIRMEGAEVCSHDDLVRRGKWPVRRPFPLVLGLAGAGQVAAVGSNVIGFAEQDTVFAYGGTVNQSGAWAEYMTVPASCVARAPETMETEHSGALPLAGLTAYEALTDILQVQDGDVVLISAASGGIGHLAVQIAVDLGAHVVATTSRANLDLVSALGAETVVDYTSARAIRGILASYPDGVDKALNGVSGEPANALLRTLRDGGHMLDLTGAVSAERRGVRVTSDFTARADGDRLARVAALIDDGVLQPEIQHVFAFEQASDALALALAGHVRGRIALRVA